MKLHLTDGQSQITTIFCETQDMREVQDIRRSARPIATAMKHAKTRMARDLDASGEPFANFYPIQGLALEGLQA